MPISVECDDTDVTAGLARATGLVAARAETALPGRGRLRDDGDDVLARVACGARACVRALLDIALATLDDDPLRDSRDHAGALHAVARIHAWTDATASLRQCWPRIRAHADGLAANAVAGRHAPRRSPGATLRELARLAEDVGDGDTAARCRSAAAGLPAPAVPRPLDARLRDWRAHAIRLEADGRPSGDADAAQAAAAETVLADFVRLVLGAEPDAARGRLRLRLATMPHLVVRDLPLGSTTIDLSCRAEPGLIRLRVEQTAGAIPITLLFEPLIAGPLDSAAVDGKPALLEPQPWSGRIRVPVQLVLDHERTLDLALRPGAVAPASA